MEWRQSLTCVEKLSFTSICVVVSVPVVGAMCSVTSIVRKNAQKSDAKKEAFFRRCCRV